MVVPFGKILDSFFYGHPSIFLISVVSVQLDSKKKKKDNHAAFVYSLYF